ncbi:TetR/AcrR family transcriptional regulator [Marinomonas spartinae]|uniref:TetR/AcrR family transcriptional regulator n=1 Tax=Marinomonas spartinae TaxID=1792290 RepID=UPI0018F23F4B|nr:TetR/AcrR family transcriptional regulator [Marinomonas spartinae]MBJ7553736.1 TetR/AcrR family transcriptional regulator [Marinomonas spartinae]
MARGRPTKKSVIVEAACQLFTQQGYQGTSIDQVVTEANVSKPTVYSNFPTKLILWETVLETLTEQTKAEMMSVLSTIEETSQDMITGWIALWRQWIALPERLAAYRILLGEQHKMEASTVSLFANLELVLEMVLLDWLASFSVSNERLFALKAITKEALLMPSLMNQKLVTDDALKAHLSWIL